MIDRFKIALIQMAVCPQKDVNLGRAEALIRQAAGEGAQLVVLPEMFSCPYDVARFGAFAEAVPEGPTCVFLAGIARELGIHLVGGSIPEHAGDQVFNTATLWDPAGALLLQHRKVHLFDIDIPGGITFMESDTLSPGQAIEVAETELGVLGLAICYDIRFPECIRRMALKGADLVIIPGAFNTTTGPVHWEIHTRTRAIENTIYLAACSPAPHPEVGYPAWGHSMVVDPFGEILVVADREERLIFAEFDRARLDEVRRAIPVLSQRRPELY